MFRHKYRSFVNISLVIFLHFTIVNRAVDGKVTGNYRHRSCSHTMHDEDSPWLVVDLGGYYEITHVKIKNRGDCCSE